MFRDAVEWAIPETAPKVPSSNNQLLHLSFGGGTAAYVRGYSGRVGFLAPETDHLLEVALTHRSGAPVHLWHALPLTNRPFGAGARRFVLAAMEGLVVLDPAARSATLYRLGGTGDTGSIPTTAEGVPYTATEWFAKFMPQGLHLDSKGRLLSFGVVSRRSWFNPNEAAVVRWDRDRHGAKYASVWRLNKARFRGGAYRFWEDKRGRIWFTLRHTNAGVTGGNSLGMLDSKTGDVHGWMLGSSGAGGLAGHRDMGGVIGDDTKGCVWFTWPRHGRVFKFPGVFSPFQPAPVFEWFYHPQASSVAHPDPDFGSPHELLRHASGDPVFLNDDQPYVGALKRSAAPTHRSYASYQAWSKPPLLYDVVEERLAVQVTWDARVPRDKVPVYEVLDMHPRSGATSRRA